jgi:hypothetical protein
MDKDLPNFPKPKSLKKTAKHSQYLYSVWKKDDNNNEYKFVGNFPSQKEIAKKLNMPDALISEIFCGYKRRYRDKIIIKRYNYDN